MIWRLLCLSHGSGLSEGAIQVSNIFKDGGLGCGEEFVLKAVLMSRADRWDAAALVLGRRVIFEPVHESVGYFVSSVVAVFLGRFQSFQRALNCESCEVCNIEYQQPGRWRMRFGAG